MPARYQRKVSLPRGLVEAIEDLVDRHPELGYASATEFIRRAAQGRAVVERNFLRSSLEDVEESVAGAGVPLVRKPDPLLRGGPLRISDLTGWLRRKDLRADQREIFAKLLAEVAARPRCPICLVTPIELGGRERSLRVCPGCLAVLDPTSSPLLPQLLADAFASREQELEETVDRGEVSREEANKRLKAYRAAATRRWTSADFEAFDEVERLTREAEGVPERQATKRVEDRRRERP